jgi:hypothetical protein
VALVRERTIPTERPLLVGEVSVAWSVRRIPYGRNLGFLDRIDVTQMQKVLQRLKTYGDYCLLFTSSLPLPFQMYQVQNPVLIFKCMV